MKITLHDFFKKGQLWSGLEGTIESINKRLTLLTKRARESSSREVNLIQHIKHLKAENIELKHRMNRIEEKLWDLKSVSNIHEKSIIKEVSYNNTKDLNAEQTNKELTKN